MLVPDALQLFLKLKEIFIKIWKKKKTPGQASYKSLQLPGKRSMNEEKRLFELNWHRGHQSGRQAGTWWGGECWGKNEAQTVGKACPVGEGKKKGSDTFWVMQIYRAAWVELHESTANRLNIKLHKTHMTWRVFSCSLCSTCDVFLSKEFSMQWQQSFYRDFFQGIVQPDTDDSRWIIQKIVYSLGWQFFFNFF